MDPTTRVALNDGGPIITCNRRKRPWVEYDHVFREWFAGSARLTEAMRKAMVAIARRQGTSEKAALQKVAPPRDILYDAKFMDLRIKENVGRAKKEMKDRLVFYEHFSPPCTTSSPANTWHRVRTKLEPAGTQARAPEPYDQKVDDDTWSMLVTCKFARIKHEVGGRVQCGTHLADPNGGPAVVERLPRVARHLHPHI